MNSSLVSLQISHMRKGFITGITLMRFYLVKFHKMFSFGITGLWVKKNPQFQPFTVMMNKMKEKLPRSVFLVNKTRETRVLSRPAICWIHFVQIALSISKHLSRASQPSISAKHLTRASQPNISAEHLSWVSQLSTSEILKNAQKCSTISKFWILAC